MNPSYGLGVEFGSGKLEDRTSIYKHIHFINADETDLNFPIDWEPFDYVIISDFFNLAYDVQKILEQIHPLLHARSRVVISNKSYLWEWPLKWAEKLGLKKKSLYSNWLSANDLFNLLQVSGFEVVRHDRKVMLPVNIPGLSFLINRICANLPVLSHLDLVNFIVTRPVVSQDGKELSVSIIMPAKNEKGNIENCIKCIPEFGTSQEIIFIEGHSVDGTYEEMISVQKKYSVKDITVVRQSGKGKGNAVREGFDLASGEVLMILDSDLTTPPEDLPKFYNALKNRKGDFINGCRLVYPMEKDAMRFLNQVANKAFGILFSYLMGQHVKDTLCGTKVLLKKDYLEIKKNRSYFGDFDPFGDFDLLLGASKLNLKIVEVYVRYKDRQYGSTQISRFRHGWMLFRMCLFAVKKMKFI